MTNFNAFLKRAFDKFIGKIHAFLLTKFKPLKFKNRTKFYTNSEFTLSL